MTDKHLVNNQCQKNSYGSKAEKCQHHLNMSQSLKKGNIPFRIRPLAVQSLLPWSPMYSSGKCSMPRFSFCCLSIPICSAFDVNFQHRENSWTFSMLEGDQLLHSLDNHLFNDSNVLFFIFNNNKIEPAGAIIQLQPNPIFRHTAKVCSFVNIACRIK